MQSACQISAYAHYARTPVLQLKQRTDDLCRDHFGPLATTITKKMLLGYHVQYNVPLQVCLYTESEGLL